MKFKCGISDEQVCVCTYLWSTYNHGILLSAWTIAASVYNASHLIPKSQFLILIMFQLRYLHRFVLQILKTHSNYQDKLNRVVLEMFCHY